MKQVTKGIFIHKTSYTESSLIATFFTEDLGLQVFVFHGGKKNASLLFPCSLCELTFYKRPESELAKIVGLSPVESWKKIPFNPAHGTVAFFISDVIRNVVKRDYKDQALFYFLVAYILEIDRLKANELSLAVIYFLLKLTVYLGIEPQVEGESKRFFLPAEGVFSNIGGKEKITFSGNGVKLIQMMLSDSVISEVNKGDRKEAIEILLAYYQLHIPTFNVNRTLDVIREVLYS